MYALRLHQTEAGGGLLLVIPFNQVLDAAVGIQQAAQAAVVVQAGNEEIYLLMSASMNHGAFFSSSVR